MRRVTSDAKAGVFPVGIVVVRIGFRYPSIEVQVYSVQGSCGEASDPVHPGI
jgi:hypothetical protein